MTLLSPKSVNSSLTYVIVLNYEIWLIVVFSLLLGGKCLLIVSKVNNTEIIMLQEHKINQRNYDLLITFLKIYYHHLCCGQERCLDCSAVKPVPLISTSCVNCISGYVCTCHHCVAFEDWCQENVFVLFCMWRTGFQCSWW